MTSDPYRDLDTPATPAEELDAARLAEALAGGAVGGVESDMLAAARLLEAAGGRAGADELAAARLRRRLVTAAARRRIWRVVRGAAAVAALAVAGVLGFSWLGGRAERSDVAEREALARAAVARVATGAVSQACSLSALQRSIEATWRDRLYTGLEATRYDRLRRQHNEELLGTGAAAASPASVPTPGGAS